MDRYFFVAGIESTPDEGMKLEQRLASGLFATEDAREGPLAFAQKRKPQFKGR